MIAAMESAIDEAITDSGAPLEDVQLEIHALRDRFDADPDTVTETELLDEAEMLWGFLSQSFTNIRRFFKDLEREEDAEPSTMLADGSSLADGSVSAL